MRSLAAVPGSTSGLPRPLLLATLPRACQHQAFFGTPEATGSRNTHKQSSERACSTGACARAAVGSLGSGAAAMLVPGVSQAVSHSLSQTTLSALSRLTPRCAHQQFLEPCIFKCLPGC